MERYMKSKRIAAALIFTITLLSVISTACKSNLPEDLDALGDDVNYSTSLFEPTMGRKTEFLDPVVTGNTSTLPLTFKVINPRTVDGQPAPELTDKFPVQVWKESYDGQEQSIAEIEEKREIEYRPVLDIQEKSGNIFFWDSASSNFVRTQPDSGYIFDVEISNSGGRKYARNLKLKPMKERPYEPSIYNPVTGIATNSYTYPASTENLVGEKTGFLIFTPDIHVFFHRDLTNTEPGNTITFSVLDSMQQPIDIQKFDKTDWENLLHGFHPRFEDGKVTYDVAFPVPLVSRQTRYTNPSGSMARSVFAFDRLGVSGLIERNTIALEYAIYEPGHWEIQMRFTGESPQFNDED